MIIQFDKEYLLELYEKGKCKDKKHRYQPGVVKSYVNKVQILAKLKNIEDIFPIHSFGYETLLGDKKGISSIRINNQYRLEFIIAQDFADTPVITICTLIDISNHYKL